MSIAMSVAVTIGAAGRENLGADGLRRQCLRVGGFAVGAFRILLILLDGIHPQDLLAVLAPDRGGLNT